MPWKLTLLRWTARIVGTTLANALDWDDVDVAEYVDPVEYVDWDDLDYADLEEYLDERHYRDPVEDLHELPDKRGQIYFWECNTEEAATQVTSIVEAEFQDNLGREPRATHIIVTDVEQLRTLDPDELRGYVEPLGGGS